MKFSKIVNKIDYTTEKEVLCNISLNSNKIKEQKDYDYSRLNIEYIQGLFDAEGHIFITYKKVNGQIRFTKGVYIKITQKNHPEIIKYIYNFLGFGKVDKYIYYVNTFDDCLRLIKLLKPNLIVKYNQACVFEEYLESQLEKTDKYNDSIHHKREKIYRIINMEKHQIEIYEESTEDDTKLGYNNKILESSMFKKEEYKKNKSEAMKGYNNINYGKHLSEQHALNISLSTTIAKRANNPNLTDIKIREIYALKDNMKQIDIVSQYGMNREIIRRIWKRKIIPTDDPEFKSNKMELISSLKEIDPLTNKQKMSIGKRVLSIYEYIEILDWKRKRDLGELLDGKKIFITTLSVYLKNKFNKHVTIDIIKNIWSGRTKLFDFEFDNKDITYEAYLELLDKK